MADYKDDDAIYIDDEDALAALGDPSIYNTLRQSPQSQFFPDAPRQIGRQFSAPTTPAYQQPDFVPFHPPRAPQQPIQPYQPEPPIGLPAVGSPQPWDEEEFERGLAAEVSAIPSPMDALGQGYGVPMARGPQFQFRPPEAVPQEEYGGKEFFSPADAFHGGLYKTGGMLAGLAGLASKAMMDLGIESEQFTKDMFDLSQEWLEKGGEIQKNMNDPLEVLKGIVGQSDDYGVLNAISRIPSTAVEVLLDQGPFIFASGMLGAAGRKAGMAATRKAVANSVGKQLIEKRAVNHAVRMGMQDVKRDLGKGAFKRLGKDARDQIESEIRDSITKGTTSALKDEYMKRMAFRQGVVTGVGALEAGGMATDAYQQYGLDGVGVLRTLAIGGVSGAIELAFGAGNLRHFERLISPQSRKQIKGIVDRLKVADSEEAVGLFKKLRNIPGVTKFLKEATPEALQEGTQESLALLNNVFAAPTIAEGLRDVADGGMTSIAHGMAAGLFMGVAPAAGGWAYDKFRKDSALSKKGDREQDRPRPGEDAPPGWVTMEALRSNPNGMEALKRYGTDRMNTLRDRTDEASKREYDDLTNPEASIDPEGKLQNWENPDYILRELINSQENPMDFMDSILEEYGFPPGKWTTPETDATTGKKTREPKTPTILDLTPAEVAERSRAEAAEIRREQRAAKLEGLNKGAINKIVEKLHNEGLVTDDQYEFWLRNRDGWQGKKGVQNPIGDHIREVILDAEHPWEQSLTREELMEVGRADQAMNEFLQNRYNVGLRETEEALNLEADFARAQAEIVAGQEQAQAEAATREGIRNIRSAVPVGQEGLYNEVLAQMPDAGNSLESMQRALDYVNKVDYAEGAKDRIALQKEQYEADELERKRLRQLNVEQGEVVRDMRAEGFSDEQIKRHIDSIWGGENLYAETLTPPVREAGPQERAERRAEEGVRPRDVAEGERPYSEEKVSQVAKKLKVETKKFRTPVTKARGVARAINKASDEQLIELAQDLNVDIENSVNRKGKLYTGFDRRKYPDRMTRKEVKNALIDAMREAPPAPPRAPAEPTPTAVPEAPPAEAPPVAETPEEEARRLEARLAKLRGELAPEEAPPPTEAPPPAEPTEPPPAAPPTTPPPAAPPTAPPTTPAPEGRTLDEILSAESLSKAKNWSQILNEIKTSLGLKNQKEAGEAAKKWAEGKNFDLEGVKRPGAIIHRINKRWEEQAAEDETERKVAPAEEEGPGDALAEAAAEGEVPAGKWDVAQLSVEDIKGIFKGRSNPEVNALPGWPSDKDTKKQTQLKYEMLQAMAEKAGIDYKKKDGTPLKQRAIQTKLNEWANGKAVAKTPTERKKPEGEKAYPTPSTKKAGVLMWPDKEDGRLVVQERKPAKGRYVQVERIKKDGDTTTDRVFLYEVGSREVIAWFDHTAHHGQGRAAINPKIMDIIENGPEAAKKYNKRMEVTPAETTTKPAEAPKDLYIVDEMSNEDIGKIFKGRERKAINADKGWSDDLTPNGGKHQQLIAMANKVGVHTADRSGKTLGIKALMTNLERYSEGKYKPPKEPRAPKEGEIPFNLAYPPEKVDDLNYGAVRALRSAIRKELTAAGRETEADRLKGTKGEKLDAIRKQVKDFLGEVGTYDPASPTTPTPPSSGSDPLGETFDETDEDEVEEHVDSEEADADEDDPLGMASDEDVADEDPGDAPETSFDGGDPLMLVETGEDEETRPKITEEEEIFVSESVANIASDRFGFRVRMYDPAKEKAEKAEMAKIRRKMKEKKPLDQREKEFYDQVEARKRREAVAKAEGNYKPMVDFNGYVYSMNEEGDYERILTSQADDALQEAVRDAEGDITKVKLPPQIRDIETMVAALQRLIPKIYSSLPTNLLRKVGGYSTDKPTLKTQDLEFIGSDGVRKTRKQMLHLDFEAVQGYEPFIGDFIDQLIYEFSQRNQTFTLPKGHPLREMFAMKPFMEKITKEGERVLFHPRGKKGEKGVSLHVSLEAANAVALRHAEDPIKARGLYLRARADAALDWLIKDGSFKAYQHNITKPNAEPKVIDPVKKMLYDKLLGDYNRRVTQTTSQIVNQTRKPITKTRPAPKTIPERMKSIYSAGGVNLTDTAMKQVAEKGKEDRQLKNFKTRYGVDIDTETNASITQMRDAISGIVESIPENEYGDKVKPDGVVRAFLRDVYYNDIILALEFAITAQESAKAGLDVAEYGVAIDNLMAKFRFKGETYDERRKQAEAMFQRAATAEGTTVDPNLVTQAQLAKRVQYPNRFMRQMLNAFRKGIKPQALSYNQLDAVARIAAQSYGEYGIAEVREMHKLMRDYLFRVGTAIYLSGNSKRTMVDIRPGKVRGKNTNITKMMAPILGLDTKIGQVWTVYSANEQWLKNRFRETHMDDYGIDPASRRIYINMDKVRGDAFGFIINKVKAYSTLGVTADKKTLAKIEDITSKTADIAEKMANNVEWADQVRKSAERLATREVETYLGNLDRSTPAADHKADKEVEKKPQLIDSRTNYLLETHAEFRSYAGYHQAANEAAEQMKAYDGQLAALYDKLEKDRTRKLAKEDVEFYDSDMTVAHARKLVRRSTPALIAEANALQEEIEKQYKSGDQKGADAFLADHRLGKKWTYRAYILARRWLNERELQLSGNVKEEYKAHAEQWDVPMWLRIQAAKNDGMILLPASFLPANAGRIVTVGKNTYKAITLTDLTRGITFYTTIEDKINQINAQYSGPTAQAKIKEVIDKVRQAYDTAATRNMDRKAFRKYIRENRLGESTDIKTGLDIFSTKELEWLIGRARSYKNKMQREGKTLINAETLEKYNELEKKKKVEVDRRDIVHLTINAEEERRKALIRRFGPVKGTEVPSLESLPDGEMKWIEFFEGQHPLHPSLYDATIFELDHVRTLDDEFNAQWSMTEDSPASFINYRANFAMERVQDKKLEDAIADYTKTIMKRWSKKGIPDADVDFWESLYNQEHKDRDANGKYLLGAFNSLKIRLKQRFSLSEQRAEKLAGDAMITALNMPIAFDARGQKGKQAWIADTLLKFVTDMNLHKTGDHTVEPQEHDKAAADDPTEVARDTNELRLRNAGFYDMTLHDLGSLSPDNKRAAEVRQMLAAYFGLKLSELKTTKVSEVKLTEEQMDYLTGLMEDEGGVQRMYDAAPFDFVGYIRGLGELKVSQSERAKRIMRERNMYLDDPDVASTILRVRNWAFMNGIRWYGKKLDPAKIRQAADTIAPTVRHMSKQQKIAKMFAKVFGIELTFVDNLQAFKTRGIALSNGHIVMDLNSSKDSALWIFGHEFYHRMEYAFVMDPEKFKIFKGWEDKIRDAIMNTEMGRTAFQAKKQEWLTGSGYDLAKSQLGTSLTDAEIDRRVWREFRADLTAGALSNKKFYSILQKRDENLFTQIMQVLSDMLETLSTFVQKMLGINPEVYAERMGTKWNSWPHKVAGEVDIVLRATADLMSEFQDIRGKAPVQEKVIDADDIIAMMLNGRHTSALRKITEHINNKIDPVNVETSVLAALQRTVERDPALLRHYFAIAAKLDVLFHPDAYGPEVLKMQSWLMKSANVDINGASFKSWFKGSAANMKLLKELAAYVRRLGGVQRDIGMPTAFEHAEKLGLKLSKNDHPIVTFHATRSDKFGVFDRFKSKYRWVNKKGEERAAFFFTTVAENAAHLAKEDTGEDVSNFHTFGAFLNTKNPFLFFKEEHFKEVEQWLHDNWELFNFEHILSSENNDAHYYFKKHAYPEKEFPNITSPVDAIKAFHSGSWWILEHPKFMEYIDNKGYDGIVYMTTGFNFITFDPKQQKLWNDNEGTYLATGENMMFLEEPLSEDKTELEPEDGYYPTTGFTYRTERRGATHEEGKQYHAPPWVTARTPSDILRELAGNQENPRSEAEMRKKHSTMHQALFGMTEKGRKALRWMGRLLYNPFWLGEKYPGFKKVFDAEGVREEASATFMHRMLSDDDTNINPLADLESMHDYLQIEGKESEQRVLDFLQIEDKYGHFITDREIEDGFFGYDYKDEQGKLKTRKVKIPKLSKAEKKAVASVRRTFDKVYDARAASTKEMVLAEFEGTGMYTAMKQIMDFYWANTKVRVNQDGEFKVIKPNHTKLEQAIRNVKEFLPEDRHKEFDRSFKRLTEAIPKARKKENLHLSDADMTTYLLEEWRRVPGYFPRVRPDSPHVVEVVFGKGENERLIYSTRAKVFEILGKGKKPTGFQLIKMREYLLNDPYYGKRIKQYLKDHPTETIDDVIRYRFDQNSPDNVFGDISAGVTNSFINGAVKSLKAIKQSGDGVFVDKKTVEEHADILKQALFDQIATEIKSRGFARHSIGRRDEFVPGFETTNGKKLFLDYVSGAGGFISKQRFSWDAHKLISEMNAKEDEQLYDYTVRYVEDMLRNTDAIDRWSGYARGMAFSWFLAGTLKPPIVNLTQNLVTGVPWLARLMALMDQAVIQKGTGFRVLPSREEADLGKLGVKSLKKFGSAHKVMLDAMKDVKEVGYLSWAEKGFKKAGDWKFENLNDGEKKAMIEAMIRGITVDQFNRDAYGKVLNSFPGQSTLLTFARKIGGLFSRAEQFNRASMFLAAYRILTQGRESSEVDMYAFEQASRWVGKTHYIIGKRNLPEWARGASFANRFFGRNALIFRTFTHNFALSLGDSAFNNGGKTYLDIVGMSLAYLAFFGGLLSIPFLDDLLDEFEKIHKVDYRSKFRQNMEERGLDILTTLAYHGAPGLIGVNLTGSMQMGLPWGAGQGIFGVWWGAGEKVKRGYQSFMNDDPLRGFEELTPVFMSSVLRSYRSIKHPVTTPAGNAVTDWKGDDFQYTPEEAIWRALGFRPSREALIYLDKTSKGNLITYLQNKRRRIYRAYSIAYNAGDTASMNKAKQMADTWYKEVKRLGLAGPGRFKPMRGWNSSLRAKRERNREMFADIGGVE